MGSRGRPVPLAAECRVRVDHAVALKGGGLKGLELAGHVGEASCTLYININLLMTVASSVYHSWFHMTWRLV